MAITTPKASRVRPEASASRPLVLTVIWIVVGINLFLFLLMLWFSLKRTDEIFGNPLGWPASLRLHNWVTAWQGSGFGRAAAITVGLVVAASVAVLIVAAPAAYVLARYRSKASPPITMVFVLGIGIPPQVIAIPLFIQLSQVGLVNSLVGLLIIFVGISIPFTVFFLTGFLRSLPDEVEEAAVLDGAGPVRTFVQIMFPLVRSGTITALLINGVGLWNEAFLALIFLQDTSKSTLSLALLNMLSRIRYSSGDFGVLFAGISIMVLPTVVLFIALRARILEGMTLGVGK